VTLCKEGLPERTVWRVIKRTWGADPVYAYAISKAPASPPWRTFVWWRSRRWAIAQCFVEGKTALGMAPYAVRKYGGWHHHMMTTMLAHCFLWHLKLGLGKNSSCVNRVAATDHRGSCLALADVYHCRSLGIGCVGAEGQSPGLSFP